MICVFFKMPATMIKTIKILKQLKYLKDFTTGMHQGPNLNLYELYFDEN
jgi:hypothetical protein